ncbi:carboxymuconolactone decarboxylase family protein [Mesorhizobium sp. M0859]|uniref:carboxymuconolactone decarboxylase family protein n=1 Tax=Mesorhizobium sp. M0859 TaxID=2957014 RepID=UPI00333AEA4C
MKENSAPVNSSPCPPISDEGWPPEILDMEAGFVGAMNSYQTMAHHPALLKAWAPLRQHIVKDSALGPVRSELVILRTAHRLGSAYEWTHHVSRARALGFSDARILNMRGLPDGEDGLIARAVDELFDANHLSPELEAVLSAAIGRQAVIDLMATVGFYCILGYLLMTYNTPIDDDVATELIDRPLSPQGGAQGRASI